MHAYGGEVAVADIAHQQALALQVTGNAVAKGSAVAKGNISVMMQRLGRPKKQRDRPKKLT